LLASNLSLSQFSELPWQSERAVPMSMLARCLLRTSATSKPKLNDSSNLSSPTRPTVAMSTSGTVARLSRIVANAFPSGSMRRCRRYAAEAKAPSPGSRISVAGQPHHRGQRRGNKTHRSGPTTQPCLVEVTALAKPSAQTHRDPPRLVRATLNPKVAGSIPARPTPRFRSRPQRLTPTRRLYKALRFLRAIGHECYTSTRDSP
jgi:hypothetical protein